MMESELTAWCCQDTSSTCRQYTDATYSCSGVYADADYAKTFCPFVREKCGDKEKIEFSETSVNETQQISVSNLNKGDTCCYKVKSKCNSPAFRVIDKELGMNDSSVEISFIEYKKSFVKGTEVEGDDSTETSRTKEWKQPDDDKPPRNQTWEDMGSMNSTCEY